jgi:hypothetical protein
MKLYIRGMAKELSRGVFWVIDGKLLAFPFYDNATSGIAKSGNTYNHKMLWRDIQPSGKNVPYNYYPRGRVDISNKGKAIIYMNPNVDESFIPEIRSEFGITEEPTIRYDYSEHYKCYLDDGWRAE